MREVQKCHEVCSMCGRIPPSYCKCGVAGVFALRLTLGSELFRCFPEKYPAVKRLSQCMVFIKKYFSGSTDYNSDKLQSSESRLRSIIKEGKVSELFTESIALNKNPCAAAVRSACAF